MTSLPLPLVRARQSSRRVVGRSLGRLRTADYIRKWLILGALIGVVAGLGAVVFYTALHLATVFILGDIGGYHVATVAGEGGVHKASGFSRPWAVPLVVAAGGLVSGVLVYWLAPEAEGHGTDAAIDAIHHKPKGLRARAALVKIVSSAITIGSGGSGGREGPTAQISAGFGSILARALNLSPADARIAVSSGVAAGIASIFRAPLGGAVLGAELPYRDDVEVDALIPSLVASIVGFAVFGSVEGFSPIFGYHTGYQFEHVGDLAWFAVLGLATGAVGRLYAVSFYSLSGLARSFRLPAWLKPAIAGLLVGALGLAVPGVLGTGYGEVQQALDAHSLLGLPLWVVLALPFAKIVATSLSIGSGGSGGIFGPGMVIGAFTGATLWRLTDGLPGVPHDPVPFVIVGMMACFGSIAHAPLAVMLMVAEMTGNLALIAPAMIAVALAVLCTGEATIYRSQIRNRAESPAHRFTFGMPLASAVPVSDVMKPPRLVITARTPGREALDVLEELELPGAPVVNADGTFIGSLQTPALRQLVQSGNTATAGRLADAEAMTIATDASLDAAVEAIATSRGAWVPALDGEMGVAGIVATTDLVDGYRLAMRHSLVRLSRAAKGAVVVESTIGADSPAAGRRVGDLSLPSHTVVLALFRGGGLHFADASTKLDAGDTVSVLTRAGFEDQVRSALEA